MHQKALSSLSNVAVFIPLCTVENFARSAGLTTDAVRGQIRLGHLPTIKIGRYRYINLAEISRRCIEEADKEQAKIDIA